MTRVRGTWIGLAVLVVAVRGVLPIAAAEPLEIEDGVLDWIRIVGDAPAAGATVVVKPFDASGADLGTGAEGGKPKRVEVAREFQADGPGILAGSTVAALLDVGPFTSVRVDDGGPIPEGAIVIEGAFTQLDPGSKAKRYWAGFGAGKGSIEIEGAIRDSAGTVLAEFRQRRLTVMGVFGGDYESKMHADLDSLGEDIAKFLNHWVTGKKLAD